MVRLLNHPTKFDDEIRAGLARDYLSTVASLTDIDAMREVTIHDRRQDFLLRPLLQALRLVVDPKFPEMAFQGGGEATVR